MIDASSEQTLARVRAPAAQTSATRFPLTDAQAGLWYAQRLDPGNPLFNTAHNLHLRGALDIECFQRAANQAVREADALCLRFVERVGDGAEREIWQQMDESFRPWLELIDVSMTDDPYASAFAHIRADMNTPTDPTRVPLARQRLFILAPDYHIWYLRVHHLVIDGYGMTLLSNRVSALYDKDVSTDRAESAAHTPKTGTAEFGALPDVFAEDDEYRHSERRLRDSSYWNEYLANVPEMPLPPGGKAVSSHTFERATRNLPAALMSRIKQCAEQHRVPWPDLLTALTAAYWQRVGGLAEVVVGVPFMGRMGSVSARVPAMVMNVLPLRIAAQSETRLEDLLLQVSKGLIKSRRHGRFRSEQMRRDLGLLGGRRRLFGPLINILPFEQPPHFDGLDTQLEILCTGPVDDITFTFRGDAAINLLLEVDANPALYSASEVQGHTDRVLAFIERALEVVELVDVPLATPEEAHHFIQTVNQTAHDVPDVTLAALVESAYTKWAERPALTFGDVSLSYAELNERTQALAQQFAAAGVGPDTLVAVALPRSLELVIALLATLRAGAAYLPLDIDNPPQRLRNIIASAKPVVMVGEAGLDRTLGLADAQGGKDIPHWLPVDEWHQAAVDQLLADQSLTDQSLAHQSLAVTPARPDNLAYVIYTSGSTGEPKGVMIEHRAIVNRLEWMRVHYKFDHNDRFLQKTPATFDVSVWEFFLPFICGASLVVAPPGAHREPKVLSALIRQHEITTLHFVPSMLAAFLDDTSSKGLELQRVFCSGEELSADLGVRFHQTVKAELHNLYGPTEAAVDISYWPLVRDDGVRPIPIGYPVWNSRLYILDEQLRPVPAGVSGHLYLAGVQLARGYLGQPELTAERFVADPFVEGERMYHAGDVARWRDDGSVVYLGRSDHQVKLRGLRIELGEIEAVAMTSGLTRSASVIVREDRAGHQRLVGYLVPEPDYDEAALRAHLLAHLPDYMVPAAWVCLESLPTTSNGKLDRAALPQPEFGSVAGRVPETPTEKVLAQLYTEVLGLADTTDAEGDFFTLGGDSLLAVHLMSRIEREWGRDPGLGALFEHPSVEGLARVIESSADQTDHGLQPLIRLATGDDTLAPLFAVHPVGGIAWCYRQLATSLSPRRTVYGLQAPSLDPALATPDNIDALAVDYVDRLLATRPQGPYHLAGWSVGGIIAQAMAVRLQSLGREVGVVAMFDSYPSECWRAAADPSPKEALRALLAVAGYIPEDYPELTERDDIIAFLKQGTSPLGAMPDEVLDGVVRVVLEFNQLVRGHYHQRFDGPLLHFRAALDHEDSGLTPDSWQPHSGALEVVDLPFMHSQLTGAEASRQIAAVLNVRMGSS